LPAGSAKEEIIQLKRTRRIPLTNWNLRNSAVFVRPILPIKRPNSFFQVSRGVVLLEDFAGQ
jgi:hypothetical protein